jgi:hypothetical protein
MGIAYEDTGSDSDFSCDSEISDRFDSIVLTELYEIVGTLRICASTYQRRMIAKDIRDLLHTSLFRLSMILEDNNLSSLILTLLNGITHQEVPVTHISMWSYISDVVGNLRR